LARKLQKKNQYINNMTLYVLKRNVGEIKENTDFFVA
jgi:hypothetical protein